MQIRSPSKLANMDKVGGFRFDAKNEYDGWRLHIAAFASTAPARAWEPSRDPDESGVNCELVSISNW